MAWGLGIQIWLLLSVHRPIPGICHPTDHNFRVVAAPKISNVKTTIGKQIPPPQIMGAPWLAAMETSEYRGIQPKLRIQLNTHAGIAPRTFSLSRVPLAASTTAQRAASCETEVRTIARLGHVRIYQHTWHPVPSRHS